MVKKFTIPFASQGDANDIPDALQVDGKVSYTQGFGYDYERPYDDPQSKDINREDMNGLFKAITSAIGEMQQLGASEYDKSLKYPKGAIVYYNKDLYISQVDDNINAPPQQWTSIKNIADDSLKKAMNLSDLTNVAEARKNLGLGNSATLNKTDVLGASSDLLATQKLVSDTNTNLTNAVNKKWDKQDTIGTGNIVRKSITDSLDTRVTSAHNRADSAYNLANSKWSPQETVGSGKLMREGAYGVGKALDISSGIPYFKKQESFFFRDNTYYTEDEIDALINIGVHITHPTAPQYSFSIGQKGYEASKDFYVTTTDTKGVNSYYLYHNGNTTTDRNGFLRAVGSANALTESDRTSSLGTSTMLVASQKLVNDVSNKKRDVNDSLFRTSTSYTAITIENTQARVLFEVGGDQAYFVYRNFKNETLHGGIIKIQKKSGTLALLSDVEAHANGIGYDQQWVDVTSQRSAGTTYTNNTGKPIYLAIAGDNATIHLYVDGVRVVRGGSASNYASAIIPDKSTYRAEKTEGRNISSWAELR